MNDTVSPEKGLRSKEPNWVMTSRIVLIIGSGEIAASIVSKHADWAYAGGLLLGCALEMTIFPKLAWKRNMIVLLIALAAGILRIALKLTSP
jgi:uncharacterized membrane protein YdcZ (DUF606 family)